MYSVVNNLTMPIISSQNSRKRQETAFILCGLIYSRSFQCILLYSQWLVPSMYRTRLQGIMVVVFIKTNIQSKIMTTTIPSFPAGMSHSVNGLSGIVLIMCCSLFVIGFSLYLSWNSFLGHFSSKAPATLQAPLFFPSLSRPLSRSLSVREEETHWERDFLRANQFSS